MATKETLFTRFGELEGMPKNLAREDAIKRGANFEQLVLDLFKINNLLFKGSYHTYDQKSEQIDGAVKIGNIRALLEVKWVTSGLAASQLYAFLGKVEGKFIGTIGIFISRIELSLNFLNSLRSGRRQSVIVIHGDDVPLIFDPSFPLEKYLEAIIDGLSFDNRIHLSAQEFLRQSSSEVSPKDMTPFVKRALVNNDLTNVINEWIAELDEVDYSPLIKQALIVYMKGAGRSAVNIVAMNNISELISQSTKSAPSKRLDSDWFYFDELSTNFLETPLKELLSYFAGRFSFLQQKERDKFGKRLVSQWDKNLGEYVSENTFAEITKPLWDDLDTSTQEKLLKILLSFVDSSRRESFPQMKLAFSVLGKTDNKLLEPIVEEILEENISRWYEDEIGDEEWQKKIINWHSRQYAKLETYTNTPIKKLIERIINKLNKST